MKKAVYIVGAGLVIGGAATIYMLNKKRTTHTMNNVYPESETTSEKEESLAKTEPKQQQAEYGDIKNQAVGNMYTRHTDAAEVVKSSVEAIRENTKTSKKTNNDVDAISAELDDMLSED